MVPNILKYCCYATAVFTMIVTLAVIIKPAKPVMSVEAEIQQAIDEAGLNGLIELE